MNKNISDSNLTELFNGDNPEFARARTPIQIESRKSEIINSCRILYEKGGLDAVNFKAISEMTSFTRQAIYNYYKTKEEVLLDILKIEQKNWENDMYEALSSYHTLTKHEYAMLLTSVFADHGMMLELTSLLFNIIEQNVRLEKLVEFRKGSVDVYHILFVSISKYFPTATREQHIGFASTVFASAMGLYTINHMSPKQREAERIAGSFYVYPDGTNTEELTQNTLFETNFYSGVMLMLTSM